MNTQKQREQILAILFDGPMTRNQINAVTRRNRREIPVQTLCRRLRELEDMGMVTCIERGTCPLTRATNKIYRLTGSMRGQMTRERAA